MNKFYLTLLVAGLLIMSGLFGLVVSDLLKLIGWLGLLAIGFYGESMTLTATYFAARFIGLIMVLFMAVVGFHQVILWVAKEAEKRGLTNG